MAKKISTKSKSKSSTRPITKSVIDGLPSTDYKKIMEIINKATGKARRPTPAERGIAKRYAEGLKKKISKPKKQPLNKKKAQKAIAKGRGSGSASEYLRKQELNEATKQYNKMDSKKHSKWYRKRLLKDATKGISKGTRA